MLYYIYTHVFGSLSLSPFFPKSDANAIVRTFEQIRSGWESWGGTCLGAVRIVPWWTVHFWIFPRFGLFWSKRKRFDGFIIVWLCESPIFGWFTFPFSENSPVILWMKSTFLDDFSNNFCFLTYCARKISKLLSLTAPLEEVSDRQRRLDAPLAKFVGLVG